jgi:hypothetical protein
MKISSGLAVILLLSGSSIGRTEEPVPITGVGVSTAQYDAIKDIDELDQPVQMIEQEFDPSLLDNLSTPAAPPPQLRLPPVVTQKDQWRGSLCGIAKPAHIVIRNGVTWDKLWTLAIRPYGTNLPETPAIDFSKDMLVGLFMGEKLYPGYTAEILSAKQERRELETVLVVKYKNASTMQAVFNPPFPVQPFHFRKVPAFKGRIIFIDTSR